MSISSRKSGMSRRTLLKASAAISMLPASRGFRAILGAAQDRFPHGSHRPARRRRQAAGRGRRAVPQGAQRHDRRPQGRADHAGHRGNPALAKTKLQELVERHKVTVSIGPLATNEALAMDDYVRDTKVPLITTTSAATVDLKSHAVESMGVARLRHGAAGDLSARRLRRQDARLSKNCDRGRRFHLRSRRRGWLSAWFRGRRRQDRAEAVAAAQRAGIRALSRAIKHDVDAIYMGFAGSNPLRFLKQFSEFGLKGKVAVLGNTTRPTKASSGDGR